MAQLPTNFDATLYPPEQELTESLSSAPDAIQQDVWLDSVPRVASVRSRHVTCHLDENGKLVIDHIPDGYTEEERELLEHWYPELYMQPSEHARNSHKLVLTGEDVLLHARALAKEQEKEQAAKRRQKKAISEERQSEYASAHMEWIAACGQRKAAVTEAKKELRDRQQARKLATAGFNKKWAEYIAEAYNAVKEAEAVPVPPRPAKPES